MLATLFASSFNKQKNMAMADSKQSISTIEIENDFEELGNITCPPCPLLPEKSRIRYNQTFEVFMKWCSTKDIVEINENVMLVYFLERSQVLKSPASLWSEYSMLKLTISINRNQDISNFKRLKAFLKRKNDGFEPRKSKVFTKDEISKFFIEAPDEKYLMMKVIAIMGIAGACRTDELRKMKIKDIEFKDDVAIVKIQDTKNNFRRSFVITNNAESQVDCFKLLNDYTILRPKNAQDERFFYRYERGRCVNQVVGKNTISNVPREIAKFLKLKEATAYTGHSFRRTSASGVDILDLKRHEGWISSTVSESCVTESLSNKINRNNKILHSWKPVSSKENHISADNLPSSSDSNQIKRSNRNEAIPGTSNVSNSNAPFGLNFENLHSSNETGPLEIKTEPSDDIIIDEDVDPFDSIEDNIDKSSLETIMSESSLSPIPIFIKVEKCDDDNFTEGNLRTSNGHFVNRLSAENTNKVIHKISFANFGKQVSDQLEMLPVEVAIVLKQKIQNVIAEERNKLLI